MTLAVMTWMAVWWLTEAIDISATALLPIALLPVLGAASIGQATAPYAHNLIFLFLGGFLLALSMQRWGLDRRIALITLRIVGDRPPAMVAGVMLATAVMSMFVSNTATAAMMLPIALSVVHLLRRPEPEGGGGGGRGDANFALCMMPVATPPNAIVFGSGYITIPQMCKAGIWLNIMGILLITALAYAVIMPMLAAGGG